MDYINKKITLESNKDYLVVEQVNYDNNIYLFVVNPLNEDDTKFIKIKDNNLVPIDPNLFDQYIFPLFMDKLKK